MFFKRKSLVVNMVDTQELNPGVPERPSPGEKIVVAKAITEHVVAGIVIVKTASFTFRMAEHLISRKYPIA